MRSGRSHWCECCHAVTFWRRLVTLWLCLILSAHRLCSQGAGRTAVFIINTADKTASSASAAALASDSSAEVRVLHSFCSRYSYLCSLSFRSCSAHTLLTLWVALPSQVATVEAQSDEQQREEGGNIELVKCDPERLSQSWILSDGAVQSWIIDHCNCS